MELTRQKSITIVSGAIAIIVVGLYIFLYRPLIGKLKIQHLECKTIEAEVLQTRNKIASVKRIDRKKGLIIEEEVSLAIDELTRHGKLEGINLISMTPKKIEKLKDTFYRVLPIEMEIKSTYLGLAMFLSSLDELEKSLVTIRNFNIIPDKENPAKLKSKLVINMYLARQKNAE